MQVCVSGAGYVGLSNAVLLARQNHVQVIDMIPTNVGTSNAFKSPIEYAELQHYLATKPLNLTAKLDEASAYSGTDYVAIDMPNGAPCSGTTVGMSASNRLRTSFAN
jgi:UDPglucose 6-dehydrogenase